jgi:hypothetical protein
MMTRVCEPGRCDHALVVAVFSALDSVWHCRQLSRREEWGAESTFPHHSTLLHGAHRHG